MIAAGLGFRIQALERQRDNSVSEDESPPPPKLGRTCLGYSCANCFGCIINNHGRKNENMWTVIKSPAELTYASRAAGGFSSPR